MRIGSSIDFHPFKEGRLFILGGVTIPYEKGLDGVSDADCLLHSIAEAILGALALGDLGTHFKEEDCKDMDSKIILVKVKNMMAKQSYRVVNVDSTILLEEPKLAPYIPLMREIVASILDLDVTCVSIKATTMEKKGIIGNKEGCLSHSVVLLEEVFYDRNQKRYV
ncbi:MAG: 2-C-methyl-D-erythritol 2,4-cyclodiphosphate synthase [Gammaproteobacteria bacterium]|nr:2-C-methyl-D-erythritol 2,4-cyclodiphosphate synthase [Gammaproteobacteria bacterium]